MFEIDLEQKFISLQNCGYSRLAIDLLSHTDVEGYDYRFFCVPSGLNPAIFIAQMNNPALSLDLGRPFAAQWPADFIGKITNPHQLKQEPYYGRIPLFDHPKVARLSDFRIL